MKDSQSLKKKQPKAKKRTFKKTSPVTSGIKEPKGRAASNPSGTRFFRPFQYVQTRVVPSKKAAVSAVKSSFFYRHEADIIFILIPLILLTIFSLLVTITFHKQQTLTNNRLDTVESGSNLNPYPFVGEIESPTVSAKAAIILDADSHVVVFSKNPQLRFSMASTTKIMTAIIALEHFRPDEVLTVRSSGIEGSGLGLAVGERFTVEDLLYLMMLPSANDAAIAIADNYPGGQDAFVAKMNEKAQSLHLTNTHFADPAGLEDDGDYTTVVDLARLAAYAITNETFVKITSTREKLVTNLDYTRQYPVENLNKLLGTQGVTGIKTGTTEGAGEVLVTSTVSNGHTFILIVMNSTQRFVDTMTLLSFISDNVQFVLPTGPTHQQ